MNDLRHSLRQLGRAPGFTLLAVLSLAVGIGINTTIFSAMDATFLRPLPVAGPDTLVKFERPELSFNEYRQVAAAMTTLADVLASARGNLLLGGAGQNELVPARTVSANYFSLLGIAPAAGRFFTARSPDRTEPVVVLGEGLWQRRFGGDPALVGRTVELSGQPFTVIGIAPRGFTGEDRLPPTEAWIPVDARPQLMAGTQRLFRLVGRMRPGVTSSQVRAEATTFFARPEWSELGVNRLGERVRVVTENESRMDHGGRLTILMGPIVGLVLLVACANVSCLLLGRYEERRREIAVRLALGASRLRVMRYLLGEGALLSLAGAGLGLLFTVWSLGAIPSVLPPTLAAWMPALTIDGRALALAAGLSVLATLAFGLAPAWRASRLDVSAMLKSDGVHLGRTPSRNVLVVAQVTIAMVFLAVAALFVRGFFAGVSQDLGFTERNLLTAVAVPAERRPVGLTEFVDEVHRSVAVLPGVRSVTFANLLAGSRPVPVLMPDDEKTGRTAGSPQRGNFVDAGYFATLGIAVLQGREFTPADNRAGARVAIVSESMARRLWPDGNPVGRTVFAGRNGLLPREVVGVVRDTVSLGERIATEPLLYLPLRQEQQGDLTVIVATHGPPGRLAGPVRAALQRMDTPADALLFDTMAGRLRMALLPQWFGAWFGGILGGLAFVLAVSGLYGVVAYAVSRRTRELGIRIAMGAAPRDALWLVLRQGVLLGAVGVALGLPLAVGIGQVIRSGLFGISPADPLALAGSGLLVIAVAALASWVPARRATRVDPMIALRAE